MPTTFERSWAHSWNAPPLNNTTNLQLSQSQLLFLKALMIGQIALTDATGAAIGSPGGLWTVAGSSNAVAAGMDGVDRWGAYVAGSLPNLVSAAAGVVHSWIVLKSPATGYGPAPCYVIIDYSSASGVNFVNLLMCKTAPTGNSMTARPTSTDETTAFSNLQLNDGTTGAHLFHGLLSSIGDPIILASKTATGFFWFGTGVHLPVSFHTGTDLFPWGLFAEYNANAPGVFGDTGVVGGSSWRGRLFDNSGTATLAAFRMASGSLGSMGSIIGTNGDAIDGTYADGPIFLGHSTPTASMRGRLVDIRSCAGQAANLASGKPEPPIPPGTIPASVIAGFAWLPCNTTPTL